MVGVEELGERLRVVLRLSQQATVVATADGRPGGHDVRSKLSKRCCGDPSGHRYEARNSSRMLALTAHHERERTAITSRKDRQCADVCDAPRPAHSPPESSSESRQ